jgi:hypothetical protein
MPPSFPISPFLSRVYPDAKPLTIPLFPAKIRYHFNNQEDIVAALFPIEPIIQAAEKDELLIGLCIGLGNPISINTALTTASRAINTLIRNIAKEVFTPEEKWVIAEHLTALGIVAIGRTDDILHTLTNTRGIDAENLMEKLREMRLSFAASGYDEIGWIGNIENKFPSGEDAGTDQ